MRRLITAILLSLPLPVHAQMAATLLADSVTVTPDGKLTASGNVEVMFEGTHMQAAAITYSQSTDKLDITGPILISAPNGDVFTADQAQLSPTLETGLLLSARMVLDNQLQLTAGRIDRTQGDLTQFSRVAATSCNICNDRPPLWEIRANRIIHDENEQQLYLENAVMRVRGVPIFWLPYMRLPDPSLERATGFLVPSYSSNDLLGTGIKMPYFIRLGDYRDLTLTPYISAETKTLEARYRQAFTNGDITIKAATSRDTIIPDTQRGYIELDGRFDLARGYELRFGATGVSDISYLKQYDYSDQDRLKSFVTIDRYTDAGFTFGEIALYQSTIAGENSSSLPPFVMSFATEKQQELIGGNLTLSADSDLHFRFGTDDNGNAADVLRIGTAADWNRNWVLPNGLVVESDVGLQIDRWVIENDPDQGGTRISPSAAITLRYPMMRETVSGGQDLLEPIIMIGWTGDFGATVPNEDSLSAELTETNLFKLSRFPGDDRIENGAQIAYGGSWHRTSGNDWTAHVVIGQIMRETVADYSSSSGLTGRSSDILAAGQFAINDGLYVLGRAVFDTDLSAQKSEILIGTDGDYLDLSASYVWLPLDTDEGRDDDFSQWAIAADYQINDIWSVGASGRYDVAANDPVKAGLSVGWRNECVEVELSASRSYTSSTTVAPTTDYSLTIGLAGFGTGATSVQSRQACRN
ncbi:hypothetical protein BVC71_04655 [Marivivens niveibacter]|uniref:LPS-assembly protein LptD n=1 Tax=Marivivens niveibacter TaxID=1930667 RepID=A0A251X273_9RHOB|nr:LPS assembly protein LptD [Marivivens niveibacter]OUD10777.1 hypothetical protein BVC71_04655 [Marivivens niveibacter]